MDCRLTKELRLEHHPVAFILSNEKPPEALEGKEGVWSCIIPLFLAAAKGKIAVFSRKSTGCIGGKVGLGFGNAYDCFPGGIEYFLSTGKEGFREGEYYIKTPELGKDFVDALPITDIPFEYVILKPLNLVNIQDEKPVLISFYVNNDQLSALTVLANYLRPGFNNVMLPFAAGCQSVFLIPFHEAQKSQPQAVVGLTDITVRPMVDKNKLSFTVPYNMFLELEDNVSGSFLEKHAWHKVTNRLSASSEPL